MNSRTCSTLKSFLFDDDNLAEIPKQEEWEGEGNKNRGQNYLKIIKWTMAGSIWLLYSVIQWFSSILRPFRGRLSKLLLMEEMRIYFFCLPGLFLTCDL